MCEPFRLWNHIVIKKSNELGMALTYPAIARTA